MTPEEQFDLLSEVTYLLVDGLPAEWEAVSLDYAVLGATVTVSGSVRTPSGTASLELPRAVPPLLARLRSGMAVAGRRWRAASLSVQPALRFDVRYEWDPPAGLSAGTGAPAAHR